MLNNNVLYYPYINVPFDDWFTKIVLYWDKIGSIVPIEFLENPEKLQPYMREMLSNNLIIPIVPDEIIRKIPNFSNSFIHFITKSDSEYTRFVKSFKKNRSKIHVGKLGKELKNQLIELNLAKPIKNSRFYYVEKKVGYYFMLYLAASIGSLKEYSMKPITNNLHNVSSLILEDKMKNLRDSYRLAILEDILPAPQKLLNIDDLIIFKNKYSVYLNNFRNEIELKLIEILNIHDFEMQKEMLMRITIQYQEQISFLVSKMKESSMGKVIRGNFIGFIADVSNPLSIYQNIKDAFGKTNLDSLVSEPMIYAAFMNKKFN